MEEKEQYTFEELCSGLEISISNFCRLAGIDEGTLARIRRGHLARRSTVNKMLRVLSEIYGIKFSLENVTGIILQREAINPIAEKLPVPSVSTPTVTTITQQEDSQIRNVARSDGLIPCKVFFEGQVYFKEKFSESSWRRWIDRPENKKGPWLKGEKIPCTILPRSGNDGIYFFTPEQAQKAIGILKRHVKLKDETV